MSQPGNPSPLLAIPELLKTLKFIGLDMRTDGKIRINQNVFVKEICSSTKECKEHPNCHLVGRRIVGFRAKCY